MVTGVVTNPDLQLATSNLKRAFWRFPGLSRHPVTNTYLPNQIRAQWSSFAYLPSCQCTVQCQSAIAAVWLVLSRMLRVGYRCSYKSGSSISDLQAQRAFWRFPDFLSVILNEIPKNMIFWIKYKFTTLCPLRLRLKWNSWLHLKYFYNMF